eukprot:1089060-Pleurochrysis_carterae.AAC.1
MLNSRCSELGINRRKKLEGTCTNPHARTHRSEDAGHMAAERSLEQVGSTVTHETRVRGESVQVRTWRRTCACALTNRLCACGARVRLFSPV